MLSNVKVYAVMWTSAVNATTQSSIGGFYQAATANPYWDWLNEYNTNILITAGSLTGDAGTNQFIGRGEYAGLYTITPVIATGTTVSDTQIQQELDAQIKAGNLPLPDPNTIYMTYFPQGYTITSGRQTSCANRGFCAYHSTYTGTYDGGTAQAVYYGVFPDFAVDCAVGCGTSAWFNNLCSASSHEMAEATSDSNIGLTATVQYPIAWYDSRYGEIGDTCNQHQDTITSIFNGTVYTVQQEYSKLDNLCVTTRYYANDYDVWLNPNTVALVAGSVATQPLPVYSQVTNGTVGNLNLRMTNVPTGVSALLGTTSLAADAGTTLTVSAPGVSGRIKDAVAVLTATFPDGGDPHTAGLLINVTVPANDFSMTANPTSVTLAQGSSQPVTISTAVLTGTAETVTFSTGALPSGVTASFSAASVTAGGNTVLTLTASASAALGAVNVLAYGTSPSTEHDVSIALNVTAPGGLAINPSPATVAPKGSQTFTASGGSGSGYSWSLTTNASGGSIGASTGAYTAGATGGVTDVVQVRDSSGNTARANVSVTAGVSISPSAPSVPPKGSQTFTASGGSNAGFTWALVTNRSGGTINATTGVYTAGPTGSVTDVVGVMDSLTNAATTNVSVTPGVSISPPSASVQANATQSFSAVGGSDGGFTWSLTTNASGGSINAATGLYTAGPTSGVTDVVSVVDSLTNTANANVTVTAPPVPDAGIPDAGIPDAGIPDAGTFDAGTPRPDGGTGADGGVFTDAGTGTDGGSVTDGGSAGDAGTSTDGGSAPDGGSGIANVHGCGCSSSGGGGELACMMGLFGLVQLTGSRRRRLALARTRRV